MIYGFDTDDAAYAVGALCVYTVYRSRDVQRFKIDKQVWDRIERFTKSAAKRARTLPQFIERLKPKMCCGSLKPVDTQADMRVFIGRVFEEADDKQVLAACYQETCMVIALVRDRLEREKQEREKEDV